MLIIKHISASELSALRRQCIIVFGGRRSLVYIPWWAAVKACRTVANALQAVNVRRREVIALSAAAGVWTGGGYLGG